MRLLSRDEVTEDLGISAPTLYRWEKMGMPLVKRLTKKYYDPDAIINWRLEQIDGRGKHKINKGKNEK